MVHQEQVVLREHLEVVERAGLQEHLDHQEAQVPPVQAEHQGLAA